MKAKLSKGSNLQKWLVGRVLCADSHTAAFSLFLHLLLIQGFQEASFMLSVIGLNWPL